MLLDERDLDELSSLIIGRQALLTRLYMSSLSIDVAWRLFFLFFLPDLTSILFSFVLSSAIWDYFDYVRCLIFPFFAICSKYDISCLCPMTPFISFSMLLKLLDLPDNCCCISMSCLFYSGERLSVSICWRFINLLAIDAMRVCFTSYDCWNSELVCCEFYV